MAAVRRGAVLLGGLLLAAGAYGQVSGSVALTSDYRFRGVSLSDEKPAAQFGIAYDHASGWYAGAFGSTVQLANQADRHLQLLSYLGYAWRARSGLSWEAGAGYTAFSGAGGFDYPQAYLGVAANRWNSRLYYAPNYFGQGSATLYAELNGTRPLNDRFHLQGHVGLLRRMGSGTGQSRRYGFDLSAGVGADLQAASIQLAWVVTDSADTLYPIDESRSRNALVLSVLRSF